ncbi:Respiratory supercomplex factor 1, mitochondrial [Malassezia sp. CBS 17886]|nr:Respiratory supercomplex factor 1, mitochondrial [Malassezia sp. CBS 17886]
MALPQGDYVPLPQASDESGLQRLTRRMKQEPLVPIGSLLTVAALTYASVQLRRGDRDKFQRALRWRVGLQTVTVVAAAAGLFMIEKAPAAPAQTANGSPAAAPHWNKDTMDRRERASDAEWRGRFVAAHTREQREEAAVQRMVDEALAARAASAALPPAIPSTSAAAPAAAQEPADAAAETDPRSLRERIGQDKRSFTF